MINEKIKYYGSMVVGGTLFGVLIYFLMMSLDLVNSYDGIWHWSNFIAGDWEISLGRGLQRYFDKLRFGVVSTSLNTVLTLLITVVAMVFIIEILEVKSKIVGVLLIAMVISHPTMCSSLSYSYMSVNFGLAFLFSVLATLILKIMLEKEKIIFGIIGGGLCVAFSMASYQAYLGVTCILLLTMFIKQLLENYSLKKIKSFFLSGIIMIVTGGVFYWCIVQVLLLRAGIVLATYGGANNAKVGNMIKNFPASVIECYRQFGRIFINSRMYINLPLIEYLLIGFVILSLGSAIYQFVVLMKKNKLYAILYLLAIMLIPVAANAVLLVAVGSTITILMSMGMVICIGLIYIHIPNGEGYKKYVLWIYVGMMSLLIWFNISTVSNDQLALKEGKVATITLSQNITCKVIESGFYEQGKPIALVGRPAENNMFPHNYAYETANEYARFGSWSTEAGNNRRSWLGVFSNFAGMNINLVGENEYNALRALEEVKEMPEFPSVGSIKEIQGAIVVKVSELY